MNGIQILALQYLSSGQLRGNSLLQLKEVIYRSMESVANDDPTRQGDTRLSPDNVSSQIESLVFNGYVRELDDGEVIEWPAAPAFLGLPLDRRNPGDMMLTPLGWQVLQPFKLPEVDRRWWIPDYHSTIEYVVDIYSNYKQLPQDCPLKKESKFAIGMDIECQPTSCCCLEIGAWRPSFYDFRARGWVIKCLFHNCILGLGDAGCEGSARSP